MDCKSKQLTTEVVVTIQTARLLEDQPYCKLFADRHQDLKPANISLRHAWAGALTNRIIVNTVRLPNKHCDLQQLIFLLYTWHGDSHLVQYKKRYVPKLLSIPIVYTRVVLVSRKAIGTLYSLIVLPLATLFKYYFILLCRTTSLSLPPPRVR